MRTLSLSGIRRRLWRRSLRRRLRLNRVTDGAGLLSLPGYGLDIRYPNERICAYQLAEVFNDDCYGVHPLPDDAQVLDIGANIGLFSLYVLWRKPHARVVAIEPDPINQDYLRRNLAPWMERGRVTLIEGAVGAARGSAFLEGDVSDSMQLKSQGRIPVSVFPLEAFLDRPYDLVKMDIEGAEYETIAAATPAMKQVSRLVVEFHVYQGQAGSLGALVSLLEKGGFTRFAVTQQREFKARSPGALCHCCLVNAWREPAQGA